VTRINKGDLYTINDGEYFSMFYITPKGVVVIDAPPTTKAQGQTIPQIIGKYTTQPIKWVIYSHHHLDHIGDAGLYPKNAEYICHKRAEKQRATLVNTTVPACTHLVGNSGYNLTIDSTHTIQLDYWGPLHTEGNLYIWIANSKLLMVVDFVFSSWGPYQSLGMQGSLVWYSSSFNNVLSYPFQYYVGGHVDRIGFRNDVTLQQQFWNDLNTAVKAAIANVDFTPILESFGGYNGTNSFSIYSAYNSACANYCVNQIYSMGWDSKLIDLGAFINSHCYLVLEHVNINY